MTVAANNYLPLRYTGDGATTAFNFTWPILEASDLVVVLFDTVALTLVTLVLGVDYTLAPESLNTPGGGSVVVAVAPTATQALLLLRALPATQGLSLQAASGFDPHDLEQEFDRLVLLVQQLLFTVSSCLRLPASLLPANFNTILPASAGAAQPMILATKPDGSGLTLISPLSAAAQPNQRVVNADQTQLTTADDVVLADCTAYPGGMTVILPAAGASKGKTIKIKKNNGSLHVLTITSAAGLIDGAASLGSGSAFFYLEFYCDGTQWLII